MRTLKVVLFDLGSTLIYSKDPWPPIYKRADQALLEALRRCGVGLEADSFHADFDHFLDAYYAQRGTGTVEMTTAVSLAGVLARKGFRDVPEAVIRSALDAMYAVTQQNWYLEDDAISTLETLRERGYRLGMISNTSDDKNVQQLVDRWGLRPFFDLIVTSAGCGIRKPDERIFHIALDYFEISPDEAAMIGDTFEADILGAKRLGMVGIWITRRATGASAAPCLHLEQPGDDPATDSRVIRPDVAVHTLSEISAVLAALA